ncbi:MAG: hypothetical protein AB7P14_05190 [Blastocatellales bacterium]
MATSALALRVAALEAEVAQMKEQLAKTKESSGDWLDEIFGAFDNDPHFAEAMRLGREYRESLRPKPRRKPTSKKSRKATKGRSR